MDENSGKRRESKLEWYRKQGKIHAKAIDGRFNRLRWAMVWLTQIVFYGACWLNWDSNGTLRQAILFDIAHEKFYLFGLVLWPQDALLLALLLILAATALFFVTALAGRLFCGFACPQTVYTAIFTWVEARVEGDHLARMRLDQGPLGLRKTLRKLLKHGLWALIAAWTAISFVGYFTPIRDLLASIATLATGPWESFWLIFYGVFTYVQAGLAREAVCQHMCPYARFQGVMFDPATRNVAYDRGRGDCIDCGICVAVCPTGIDIRAGLQYQCINCGLCIDGCDPVMDKIGAPRGLIRFASANELAGVAASGGWLRRPRLLVYASLLLALAALGGWSLSQRPLLRVDVLRDRGALLRETAEGRIENAYTLKLMNVDDAPRRYRVAARGLAGLEIVGAGEFTAEAGSIQPVAVTLSAPAAPERSGILPIEFEIVAVDAPAIRAREKSSFALP